MTTSPQPFVPAGLAVPEKLLGEGGRGAGHEERRVVRSRSMVAFSVVDDAAPRQFRRCFVPRR